jgi:hypothetical protein
MQEIKLIRIVDVTELNGTEDKFIIHDLADGKYYFGNGNDVPTEITTDNSNKWAKMFFYGSD